MNTRAFSLAFIIAGMAVFMVYTYIQEQQSEIIKKFGVPITVVVAKRDIKELELIDDTKVVLKTVPQDFAMPGSFRSIKQVENTIASVPIVKGEQITKPRVTYPGQNGIITPSKCRKKSDCNQYYRKTSCFKIN